MNAMHFLPVSGQRPHFRAQTAKRLAVCALAALAVFVLADHARATMIQSTSISQISGTTVPFDTAGSAASQTIPFGVNTFPINSFANTSGINGSFTGNANAPIGPPSALSLGPSPGAGDYFQFSPLSGYQFTSIGIAATGGFTDQSTTFHVSAVDEAFNLLQYDLTMTPTTSGIAGLNGGAVFLGVSSTLPLLSFRVWQLDDGFGILDNLRVNVAAVPEPSTVALASLALFGVSAACIRRRFNNKRNRAPVFLHAISSTSQSTS